MPGYRLACPFSGGGLTKGHYCEDGSIHMDKLRSHLRYFHTCNCPDPSVCAKPRHVSKELVDRMIAISYDKQVSKMDRWAKMYQAAFPTHRRVPGPCVPRVRHTLSLAQHPGSEFKNAMIRRLVRGERLSLEKANKDLQTFLNRLPLFYDVLSHPEVWSRGRSSVSDESGDEVDEPSTTQPVEVAEPLAYEEPDLSIQQDDGAADEKPDTQAEQETPPSPPTSS
ncbi:hypothetical protein MRS44_005741 [Fusarium solani]|uniref:uncharacterized protein n=1 Tax=Fusarium solani TaxID=169388 RepID=UPI0032C45919|nr:hypothetical protein MRS44_005741 [Fusarium solani]